MPFARPTLTELVDQSRANLDANLPGADSRLRRSVLDVLARIHAWAVHGLYGFIAYVADQIFPDTADVEHLERWAAIFGLQRTAATFSAGDTTFTGTTGVAIPAGTELQRADGTAYTTDAEYTLAGGTVTGAVIAKVAGASGEASAGVKLSFLSPVAGVDNEATVAAGGLSGGNDVEDDAGLRDRVLMRMQQPPHGGASFDYVRWAKEVPGVTRAWLVTAIELRVEAFAVAAVNDPASDVAGTEFDATGYAFVEFLVQAGAFTSGTLNLLVSKADSAGLNDEDASGDVVDGSLPAMTAAGIHDFTVAVDPAKPKLTVSVDDVGDPIVASVGVVARMGLGDVLLLFVRDDDSGSIFPDASEIAAVQTYIDDAKRRPVTAQFRADAPEQVDVNFDIRLTPDTTAVRAAVEAELRDLLRREAAPGVTIPLTHVAEAISIAAGETDHNLIAPAAELVPTATQLHVPGTFTWE